MNSLTWLRHFSAAPSPEAKTPSEMAASELLRGDAMGKRVSLHLRGEMGEGFSIAENENGYTVSGGESGLLYGVYRLLEALTLEKDPAVPENRPKYGLRMINCWDNMDGFVERGYSGRSLFFEGGRLDYDPERIRTLGRMLASVGLNAICINNVNVHAPAQRLIEDMLPEVSTLAEIFRPFGVRLILAIDFSSPMRHGIGTADPLDPAVRTWWKKTADRVYGAIPDLAGFLVKADSENRPGPFTYGRNHADGANMLAEALKPHGGVLIWRCFVYNCRQDWRDTATDRPKAAYEHYAYLDGSFAENVILQVKHGPFDFQVREPVSPLLFGMRKTNLALEIQLAQEYTGHQIDLYTMAPMWKEIFGDLPAENIMAVAAVSNLGRDENYTGHPLAAANLYACGRFSWDPSSDPAGVTRDWAKLSYALPEDQNEKLTSLLLRSRSTYEKYTAPLGICWMVTPHEHYGPNPSGYEYDLWGTYHKADRNAIGIDRTAAGTGYLEQYPEKFRQLYSTSESCPDPLKLFFHRLPYDYRMSDGRTLVQRIYDDHFEGYEETEAMQSILRTLDFPEPDRTLILERMEKQRLNAREWRDIINTFFHRLSGIPDEKGRTIYE